MVWQVIAKELAKEALKQQLKKNVGRGEDSLDPDKQSLDISQLGKTALSKKKKDSITDKASKFKKVSKDKSKIKAPGIETTKNKIKESYNNNILTVAGRTFVGLDSEKGDNDRKLGPLGALGQTIGDTFRSKLGLDTTAQRGSGNQQDAITQYILKQIQSDNSANLNNTKQPVTQDPAMAFQKYRNLNSTNIRPDKLSTLYGNKAKQLVGQSRQDMFNQDIDKAVKQQQELIPGKVAEQEALAKTKWTDEDVERKIKFDVVDSKMQFLMEQGGLGYQELVREAKDKLGLDLKLDKGGWKAWEARFAKAGLNTLSYLPQMEAVKNLGPELGTELMRQIGAFRSGEMAEKFRKTLPQFTGNIKTDMANTILTMGKNTANIVLLDKDGKPASIQDRMKKMHIMEANAIRGYNKLYKAMGLIDEPYTKERSFKWIAENSQFNKKEEELIKNAMDDNPGYKKNKIAAQLIKKGLL